MSFSIEHIKENGLFIIRLTDHLGQTSVDILPAYGALLHSFRVASLNGTFDIVDHYTDVQDIESNLNKSYKSSKLSPFVCRIPEGKYEWDGEKYEFATKFKDGSAIHGLLYNKAFLITEEFPDDNQASLGLRYHYKKEDPGYPFEYNCDIMYTLHPDKVLQVETTLLNLGNEAIPIADGWHPYFTLGGSINDYELQMASDVLLEFNDKLIPTGKQLLEPSFIKPALLGDRFLDNCFLLQVTPEEPVCTLHNPNNGISLSLFTNNNYPYLQLYTPDHRNSIAIENLSGAPDCFNNGMGLKVLEPRHSETFNVWYKVHVD